MTTKPIFYMKPRGLGDQTKITITNKFRTGTTTFDRSAEVTEINSYSKEGVMRSILEFREAIKADTLNIFNNGGKLFSAFRQICSLSIKDDWDAAADGQPNTQAGFQAALEIFIGNFFKADDFNQQVQSLQDLRETDWPKNWKVKNFKSRITIIDKMMRLMPNAVLTQQGTQHICITDINKKNILWRMCRKADRKELQKQGIGVAGVTYQELCTRLENLEVVRDDDADDNNKASNKSGNKRRQQNQGGRGQRRQTNSSNRNSSSRSSTCPFPGHNNHTWHNCFANPNGPNYRPEYRPELPNGNNNSSGSSNNGNSRGSPNRAWRRNGNSNQGRGNCTNSRNSGGNNSSNAANDSNAVDNQGSGNDGSNPNTGNNGNSANNGNRGGQPINHTGSRDDAHFTEESWFGCFSN